MTEKEHIQRLGSETERKIERYRCGDIDVER